MSYPSDWYCTECYKKVTNSKTCQNCGFNPYPTGEPVEPVLKSPQPDISPKNQTPVSRTYKGKRPGVVWIFTLINAYFIYSEVMRAISTLTSIGNIEPPLSTVFIVVSIATLLIDIPRIIMTLKFFMLRRDAIQWAHISYGLGLLFIVATAIIVPFLLADQITTTMSIMLAISGLTIGPTLMVSIGLYAFMWWAVVDYAKKKKVDGQPIFT